MKDWLKGLWTQAKEWVAGEVKNLPDKMHTEAAQEIESWNKFREPMKKLIVEKGEAAADDMVDIIQAQALDLEGRMIRKVFPNWRPGGRP